MIVNPSGKRRIFKRKAFRYVFAAGLLLLLMGLIFLPAMPKQSDSVFPDYAKDTLPHLNLLIGEAQMKKIQEKRSEAFKTGILVTDETDELQAKLVYNGQSANALIRLKGDWVDHLKGQKWSFRINLEPPHTFSQLSDFSIQAPATRSFLSEWFFHQLLKEEGILTTKFEFVHLLLNGQNKGLFAYEEHFTKHIPESGFRREGPLLKISEEGMWNARVLQEELGVFILEEPEPFYPGEAAPFKSGQILKDTVLAREFSIARNLLHQFKYQLATASDLMDIELSGKFMALTDLTRTYHGLLWHNIRFYYNPITSRLEPVGYDGDTGSRIFSLIESPLLGQNEGDHGINMALSLLKDPLIRESYWRNLKRYSDPAFLDDLWLQLKPKMDYYEALIAREYPGYFFDYDAIRDNAKFIRNTIKRMEAEGGWDGPFSKELSQRRVQMRLKSPDNP